MAAGGRYFCTAGRGLEPFLEREVRARLGATEVRSCLGRTAPLRLGGEGGEPKPDGAPRVGSGSYTGREGASRDRRSPAAGSDICPAVKACSLAAPGALSECSPKARPRRG